jgi:hypothetical protein
MNIKKLVLLMVLSGTLTACGGSDDKATASKELFSSWSAGDAVLDLTGYDFEVTNPLSYATSANTGCHCSVIISGTQSSGTAYIWSCSHYGPQNTCSPGGTYYDYTNVNATLTLCDGTDCAVYR